MGICVSKETDGQQTHGDRRPSRPSFTFRRRQSKAAKERLRGQNRKAVKAAAGELHTAACQDNCGMIATWLHHVHPDFRLAVLDYGGMDGWTALHFASRHGRPRAAALLLNAGASTAAKDDYSTSSSASRLKSALCATLSSATWASSCRPRSASPSPRHWAIPASSQT